MVWNGTIKIYVTKTKRLFTTINIYKAGKYVRRVQVIRSDRSHLFEFLSLSLTDRWLEDLYLQLGQLSCWDLRWELCLLATLL